MQNKENKIICVFNDRKTFDEVICKNQSVKDFQIIYFDNTLENVGISKRYNSYLQTLTLEDNFWIIFCHQDFGFKQNPLQVIKKLDKNCIYGPIGVKFSFSLIKFIKNKVAQKLGYHPSLKINFKRFPFIAIEKHEVQKNVFRRKFLGQILQGNNNYEFKTLGKKLKMSKEVSNLDCCCLIVHSSLIKRHDLKFDQNLDWHMYVEDFCINASKNHKIKLKAVQFDCFHLGIGNLNEDFFNSVKYVKDKYSLKHLFTTCIED